MNGMTASTAPIVKLATTADLLAFLPTLAGVSTRNSVVVAPFEGNRASRAMRISAPSLPTTSTARGISSMVLGHLARMTKCDRVAVAVYRDDPLAEIGACWSEMLGLITERLHESGYHINDAAIVGADGWIALFDGNPAAPRPLSEIAAAAERIPDDLREPFPDEPPSTDPKLAELVTELVVDRIVHGAEADAFGVLRRTDPPNPIDLLEKALAEAPHDASARTLASLIAQIESEGAVDRTVLQIAFGREVGSLSWESTLTLRREAAERGCAPSDLMMGKIDEQDPHARRIGDLLTGRTVELPSPERLRAGADLLGRAIAHCRLPDRAWAMCALAWVHWALGLANSADRLIESAQRVDPDNSLAPVYRTLFSHVPPEWLFHSPALNRAARRRATRDRGRTST
jgi:hypothetical protein